MGIENMRRWPMYIVFSVCILLTLSLLNSWSLETELRTRIAEISSQLKDCSKQQTSCMEESLSLLEQKERYVAKKNELEKESKKLNHDIANYKEQFFNADKNFNRSMVDLELCKTELQSLRNLQLTKSATLETLRLEKETLTTQLEEKKERIELLEKEMEKLKLQLTTKSAPNPQMSSKVPPAAAPPKQSPAVNVVNNVMQEPEPPIENNDAKEDFEDTNVINEGNDFDPQLNK